MGIAKFVGTAIGKKAGKIGGHTPDVEWINGIPVVRHSYKEWLGWLIDGESASKDFLQDVVNEAIRRKDFEGLRILNKYLIECDLPNSQVMPMIKMVLEQGKMLKMLEQIANPFDLVMGVIDYL